MTTYNVMILRGILPERRFKRRSNGIERVRRWVLRRMQNDPLALRAVISTPEGENLTVEKIFEPLPF